MSFNSNISALKTQRALSQSTSAVTRSFERLATGLRINRASDDAAGLAIADNLKTETRLYSQAARNVNDGISLLNIINETLDSQSSITTRLIELAQQSANGTLSSVQRDALNDEYQALVKEFGRLGDTTKFNGLSLLKGDRASELQSIALQVGITGASTSQLTVNTADTATLSGVIDYENINVTSLGVFNTITTLDQVGEFLQQKFSYQQVKDNNGQTHDIIVGITSAFNDTSSVSLVVFARGADVGQPNAEWKGLAFVPSQIELQTDPESGYQMASSSTLTATLTFAGPATAAYSVDISGLRFQYSGITANIPANTVQDPANQPGITAIDFTGVETQARSRMALTLLDNRLADISQKQGQFGAIASRLSTSLAVLGTSREGTASAESRIRDVDVAEETSTLAASQIRQQAGAAILSQSITQPQLLLRLLTG